MRPFYVASVGSSFILEILIENEGRARLHVLILDIHHLSCTQIYFIPCAETPGPLYMVIFSREKNRSRSCDAFLTWER